MWPFTRRSNKTVDPLTLEVDLAPLGPFGEVERYLIIWDNALAQSYGLAIVYEGRRGTRIHIVHSHGYAHGGSMETHAEWVATQVRRHDPAATALFFAWPSDVSDLLEPAPELIRVQLELNPSGVSTPRQTILMSEDDAGQPQVDNVFTKPGECLYSNASFGPRQHADHWARTLGCPIPTFTIEQWSAAAEQVDPGRVQRAAVEKASQEAMEGQIALMKELGVYGDEQPADLTNEQEIAQPSRAQQDRLINAWAHEPDVPTFQVGGFSIGGANLGHPKHPAPVVSIVLPSTDLDDLPIDVADFCGSEIPPHTDRRIRLWDETLLTVEDAGQWRIILYLESNLLPQWWFDAVSEDPASRTYGVIALSFTDAIDQQNGEHHVNDLGDAVGLAHLEDCRSL